MNLLSPVSETIPSAGCYDDGCRLVRYVHKRLGASLNPTPAAVTLSKVQFSVDRTHFRNHVGVWCRENMDPAKNEGSFLCLLYLQETSMNLHDAAFTKVLLA